MNKANPNLHGTYKYKLGQERRGTDRQGELTKMTARKNICHTNSVIGNSGRRGGKRLGQVSM